MNRKNTILIAVMINAALLIVLFITALTTQDEVILPTKEIAEVPLQLPKFDEQLSFTETQIVSLPEPIKPVEIPFIATAEEPVVHKLPQIDAAPPAPVATVAPSSAPTTEVIVKKGDTLEKIAKTHRVTVEDLLKLNQLTCSFLKIGQKLKIPVERTLSTPVQKQPELGPEYYTMKVGENPWAIAMKHHMKVDELLRLNGLNEEKARKLKPGDRLRIR